MTENISVGSEMKGQDRILLFDNLAEISRMTACSVPNNMVVCCDATMCGWGA